MNARPVLSSRTVLGFEREVPYHHAPMGRDIEFVPVIIRPARFAEQLVDGFPGFVP